MISFIILIWFVIDIILFPHFGLIHLFEERGKIATFLIVILFLPLLLGFTLFKLSSKLLK